MSEDAIEVGRTALATALARAGKRASVAATVAALVPLALAATAPPAAAQITTTTIISANTTVNNAKGGAYDYSYAFTAGSGATGFVTQIELPEVRGGEFLTGSGGFLGSIPNGWDVAEQTSSAYGSGGTAGFKSGDLTPAAFIELTYLGGEGAVELGSAGGTLDLTLESDIGATLGANAEYTVVYGEGGHANKSVDPLTPDPAPEPASLAVLGTALAGVAALRRRKKA